MIPVLKTSAKDCILNSLKSQRLLGTVQIMWGFSFSLVVILEDKVGEINNSYLGQIIQFKGPTEKKNNLVQNLAFCFKECFKTGEF